jgi:hypothetical protein
VRVAVTSSESVAVTFTVAADERSMVSACVPVESAGLSMALGMEVPSATRTASVGSRRESVRLLRFEVTPALTR